MRLTECFATQGFQQKSCCAGGWTFFTSGARAFNTSGMTLCHGRALIPSNFQTDMIQIDPAFLPTSVASVCKVLGAKASLAIGLARSIS